MEQGVLTLLGDAGIRIRPGARGYRPDVSLQDTEAKILKPQNVVEMLALGSRDLGFAGADWVAELEANVVELLGTPGFRPCCRSSRRRQDAARGRAPAGASPGGGRRNTSGWRTLDRTARALRRSACVRTGDRGVPAGRRGRSSWTNTATGATLEANGLVVVDELMRSSTRLYANPLALEDRARRRRIDDLVMLLDSVLVARRRVMLEVNASAECLEAVVAVLPSMRQATVAPLYGNGGYAVKAAVPREALPEVIPAVKAAGGTDLVVSTFSQIVP